MLIETPGGFDYTGADCSGWMKEAGFSTTRVEPLVGPGLDGHRDQVGHMRTRLSLVVLFGLLVGTPCSAQVSGSALQDEAVTWLQAYLRVDTINPPGNEAAGVQFFKAILDAEGIAYETVESSPGRGNIWARLKGGSQPALMLLHHMDVVPANKASWRTDPLSGEIKGGNLYGRGALDTKSSGILHLAAFIALHRSKAATEPRRDLHGHGRRGGRRLLRRRLAGEAPPRVVQGRGVCAQRGR